MTDAALVPSAIDPEISAALTVYERLQPLQDALGLANLTVGEMHLFAMVAHRTGLDPFTKQIYAIKRGGKVIHQTGIDGYRSVAERTGQYRGSDDAEFEPCDCGDPDSPKVHPKVARVVVRRRYPDGDLVEQPGVARWHELKPAHTRGQNANAYQDAMWWQQPEGQLAKCAEAAVLRKAFPRVFGGVYIAEEMEQAGEPDSAASTAAREAAGLPTAREHLAARRAALAQPAEATEDAAQADSAEEGTFRAPEAMTPEPTQPERCDAASPYEAGSETCAREKGHSGLHRNHARESWE